MDYVIIAGKEYLWVQNFAKAINRSLPTVYKYHKQGQLELCWPLGPALTFISRETVERFLRYRITETLGAFACN